MAAAKKQCFLRFLYWTESSPPIQSKRFTNEFGISVNTYHFAHHFVINWLFLNDANKNQHQESHQTETISDKVVFKKKMVRQKSQQGEQNTCMYVSEICAEGIFITFPW